MIGMDYKGRERFEKGAFSILLLVILVLTACQSKELIFVGEGEQWSAEDETYAIQLNYKGDNLKAVETFSYSVEPSNNDVLEYGAKEVSLNEKGVYKSKILSSNSPSTSVGDELILEVKWNGESEKLILKSKQ